MYTQDRETALISYFCFDFVWLICYCWFQTGSHQLALAGLELSM